MTSDHDQIRERRQRLLARQQLAHAQQQLHEVYSALGAELRSAQPAPAAARALIVAARKLEQDCAQLAAAARQPPPAGGPGQLLHDALRDAREQVTLDTTLAAGAIAARFERLAEVEAELLGTSAPVEAPAALQSALIGRCEEALRAGQPLVAQAFAEAALARSHTSAPARLCLAQSLLARSAAVRAGGPGKLETASIERARELLVEASGAGAPTAALATLQHHIDDEEGAVLYALAEEARAQKRPALALEYLRRVPPGSADGPRAADAIVRARRRRTIMLISAALVALAALALAAFVVTVWM